MVAARGATGIIYFSLLIARADFFKKVIPVPCRLSYRTIVLQLPEEALMLQTTGAGTARLYRNDGLACDSACRFVEALVGVALGVALADMRRSSRGRAPAAFARQTAMYLAHVHLGLSLERVGEHFGRDRTTVAHACARVEDSRDDPNRDRIVACLELALDGWQQVFGTGDAAR